MPVSYQGPMLFGLSFTLVVVALFCSVSETARLVNRKNLLTCGLIGLLGPFVLLAVIEAALWLGAQCGTRTMRFTYARWIESMPSQMECLTFCTFPFRFDQAWYWLKRSADEGHPEAMYAVAVRVKYQLCVPQTCQLGKAEAQELMNKAVEAGYVPVVSEEAYYFMKFRMPTWCIF